MSKSFPYLITQLLDPSSNSYRFVWRNWFTDRWRELVCDYRDRLISIEAMEVKNIDILFEEKHL